VLRRRAKTVTLAPVGESASVDGWDVPARFNFTRDVIEPLAQQHSRAALTFVDREGIVDRRTFREIAGDAARWAHLLRTRLDRGDRVLLAMGKVPAWHGAMLGALKGGLIAVPCSELLHARELAFRVRHSGARLVIADRSCEAEIEEMREQLESSVTVLYLDEARTELSGYMGSAPTEDTTSAERALLLYTSGTAREPRGVVHTHAYTWAMRSQAEHWLDVREDDVVWCTAGTGWAKSIWNALLGPWSHGAEIVLHQGAFDPDERLELIEKLGVTVLCQTPTEYRMLAKLDSLATARLRDLRHAVSAGEPLNPDVIERFHDALGLTVYDGYGQTENALLVANVPQIELRMGSMGFPALGHEVAVIDEDGEVCEPGAEGDIALRGRPPTLFAGYWDARDETNAAFRDGWYVTGDRAVRDEDGYFWFVGRADDVILSADYRIGPFEVESALLEHPAVAESAVVGAPDADRGEIVKAFVVLRPGHDPTADLVEDLQEHVKAVTAPYKYPREIAFVEELPKTVSGKIRRSELRRQPETGFPEPLSLVIPLPVDETERARAEDEAVAEARREAREAARRAAAAAALRAAERAALRDAEEAARLRDEASRQAAVDLARREAVEAARREADDAAQFAAGDAALLHAADAQAAQEAARREAETARAAEEAARRETEEAARAAEDAARRAAEDAARREAEEAARRAAEETARQEAEAAARAAEETARREAEAAARAAEEAARHAAEAAARDEAEERARQETEAATAAPAVAELVPADDDVQGLGRRERKAADKRRKEEEKRRKEEERLRAEEEAEQRKRDEAEAKERAKAEAEQRKRDEAEAKERAKAEAEQRKRDEALARAAAKEQAKEDRRRQREEEKLAKRRGGLGLGRLLTRDDHDDEADEEDDTPVAPIDNIVERLQQYSRPQEPIAPLPGSGGQEHDQPDAVRETSD
jgi:acyl-coenzyme A synthetase/AMP-(fatty) acid ligase